MTSQNANEPAGRKSGKGSLGKFPEPTAWALQWGFEAPAQMSSGEADRSSADPQPKEGTSGWNKFPKPRGWSLEWDGSSMESKSKSQNPDAPSTASESRADEV